MDLEAIQQQRSGHLQFLVLLLILFLGLIMVISYRQTAGYAVPTLAVLSLVGCLYVMAEERRLRGLEAQLIGRLIAKDRQVNRERERAADLGGRLKELAALYRAISTVNAVGDDGQTVPTALRAALELVGGDRGSIMLLDEGRQYLYIAGAQGLEQRVVTATRQPVGQGVAGWVAQNGEPIFVAGDAQRDERFLNPNRLQGDIRFAMCVPLMLRDRVTGVMNLASTDGGAGGFTDAHLRLATIFGQHASVAITNAQLADTLRKLKAIA